MKLLKSISKSVSFYTRFEHNRIIKKYTAQQLGKWAKNELVLMGPTFIKIGQFISTRGDIFEKELIDELKDLQDNVSPLPWNIIKNKITSIQFDSINETPLASASIGQVHLAKLNNIDVVIKVKRPDIDKQIESDFEGLLMLINWLKIFSKDRRLSEFQILFTEYYNILLEEINFIKEAENMIKFKEMFKNTKWIKIPSLYEKISTNDFIIMEYVPAIKIDDTEKMNKLDFNREKIASKLIECYMEQIIGQGLIHLDPHFSNVKITESGKIVFYDFGMVLKLDENIKLYFNDLLIGLYNKDVDSIAEILIKLEFVIVEPDKLPYFKKFIIFFISYIENMKIDDFKLTYLDSLNKTAMPFLISSKFLLLLRGLTILEGNCKYLDPEFNYKKTLDPYIDKYLINIDYFENKMMDDINILKSYPSKIKEQEINMEIMRMNTQYDVKAKEFSMQQKTIALGSILIIIAILENNIVSPIYIALISAIILF